MSDTNLAAVDVAIPEYWGSQVLVEGEKQQFWYQFEGPQGAGMPIIRKDELTKVAGDTIHIITVSNLTGSGVTGESTLESNEEKMGVGEITLNISRVRHAVRFTRDAVQRSVFDVRMAAKGRLAYWLADKLDVAMFTIAVTGATYTIFGDVSVTATGDLTTGDEMSSTLIKRAKVKAISNRALPIRTSRGNVYYALVMHTYDGYNLKADSTYNNAKENAAERGETNDIFTGALGIYDGVILFESQNVPNSSSVSSCVLFGGEAFARGYGQYPDWVEEWFDYKNKFGISTSVVYGDSRAVEANSLVIYTWAADPNA